MAAVKIATSGWEVVNFSMPSGAASRQRKRILLAPRFLELVDGGDRRVAGRQHGIDDDDQPVIQLGRGLVVVLDRLQRLVVAIDADMGDAGGRDEVEHAVEQAIAGPQDRGEHQLLALDRGRSPSW